MTTLLISQGVPMILHGDECGRTQQGNNNAYCQDNEISWMSWDLSQSQKEMLEWTKRITRLRSQHPVFRRRGYFQGRSIRGADAKDIVWLDRDGTEMTDADWQADNRILACRIAGTSSDLVDDHGNPIYDETMLIMLNSDEDPVEFTLPPESSRRPRWRILLDTAQPRLGGERVTHGRYQVAGRSLVVLSHH
jgi:glycogen operon protein